MSISVGSPLPRELQDARVTGADGQSAALSALHEGPGPSLLVFVRQFACAACGQRTTELLRHIDTLQSARTKVLLIGCGSQDHAREYSHRFDIASRPITLVTDPSLRAHAAAGLLHSYWGVLGPMGTAALVKAMLGGHRNGWGHGDFYQLGGTLLLDEHGVVRTYHAERYLGDALPITEVVDQTLAMTMAAGSALGGPLP
jgi:peroxiredoxin